MPPETHFQDLEPSYVPPYGALALLVDVDDDEFNVDLPEFRELTEEEFNRILNEAGPRNEGKVSCYINSH